MNSNNKNKQLEIIKNLNLSLLNSPSDLPGLLQLETHQNLSVYYAPFDFVNEQAKIVIVGITPGFTQLKNAYLSLQKSTRAGLAIDQLLRNVKSDASFSGSMRQNLIDMLDHIGINKWLDIPSSADLFSSRADLLHSTSALKYPVFVNGANYNGTPNMIKHEILSRYLVESLGQEVKALKDALFVPLGPKPSAALEYLANKGLVSRERILTGFLHPSAASQERVNYFLGKKPKSQLSTKTNAKLIDDAKAIMIKNIIALNNQQGEKA